MQALRVGIRERWTNALAASSTRIRVRCCFNRFLSDSSHCSNRQTAPSQPAENSSNSEITILDKKHKYDPSWFNIPPSVLAMTGRRLHLQKDHPVAIARQIIEQIFPESSFARYNNYPPVVTTEQNFDLLGFPADHPGRSRGDTYYLTAETLLRTHTSAHQHAAFAACSDSQPGYLISADVYRRDAVDRSHYPVFHQMEGALTWGRLADVERTILSDIARIPPASQFLRCTALGTENGAGVAAANNTPVLGLSGGVRALRRPDTNEPFDTLPFHAQQNPVQPEYGENLSQAVAAHLRRSLEVVATVVVTRALDALLANGNGVTNEERNQISAITSGQESLRLRWVEAYFPFTSPSWELEVLFGGEWLEVLGCGIVRHAVLEQAGKADRVGWAFGLGLERLAMRMFDVSDIRHFWSHDSRFHSQFVGVSDAVQAGDWERSLVRFKPFSRYPACYKDVSFWLPHDEDTKVQGAVTMNPTCTGAAQGTAADDDELSTHDKDVMEIVREIAGDYVEDVKVLDKFTNAKTGRTSLCYRINYRSLARTLTNAEVNEMHERVRRRLVDHMRVDLR